MRVLRSYKGWQLFHLTCLLSDFTTYCPSGIRLRLNLKRPLPLQTLPFVRSYTQTESLCSQSIAIMLQCSTCPLGTYSKLRLAPATLPTTTQDVVLLKTTCSHSKKHYHHQSYNQRTTRPLPAKSFTPYNHVLSHKTPNPSVLHLSIVISLKYHTQSIPICTQSQSQRVDAYCSTLRLCMVLHVKIEWLSLCSPPP